MFSCIVLYDFVFKETYGYLSPIFTFICLHIYIDPLKQAVKVEIKAWELLYGKYLNQKYKQKMDEIVEFQEEYNTKLNRPIKDLEDVRQAMAGLEAVRQKQIEIDMALGPIEVYINKIINYFSTPPGLKSHFDYCKESFTNSIIILLYNTVVIKILYVFQNLLNKFTNFIKYHVYREAYGVMQNFGIRVSKEEMDCVDTVRYGFMKVLTQSVCSD